MMKWGDGDSIDHWNEISTFIWNSRIVHFKLKFAIEMNATTIMFNHLNRSEKGISSIPNVNSFFSHNVREEKMWEFSRLKKNLN